VTFNYDRLLEGALRSSGRNLDSVTDYIERDDYRLIKPHGSIDWSRWVPGDSTGNDHHLLISQASELDLTGGPITQGGHANGFDRYVPAIAIPTQTKSTFECPPDHLAALEEWLPEVDRILVIGWRAQEKNFLELCAKHLAETGEVKGVVVDSSQVEAAGIAASLREVLPNADIGPSAAAGFTRFVDSDVPVNAWLDRDFPEDSS
jgi:SIR2-like domain